MSGNTWNRRRYMLLSTIASSASGCGNTPAICSMSSVVRCPRNEAVQGNPESGVQHYSNCLHAQRRWLPAHRRHLRPSRGCICCIDQVRLASSLKKGYIQPGASTCFCWHGHCLASALSLIVLVPSCVHAQDSVSARLMAWQSIAGHYDILYQRTDATASDSAPVHTAAAGWLILHSMLMV